MQKRSVWKIVTVLLIAVSIVSVAGTSAVFAVSSSSNSYHLEEGEFNSGSNIQSCSNQYCSDSSTGGLGTSNTSASFGNVNGDDPVLEVIVESGESDLGVFSTETTATKTTIVKVRSYLSGGYLLQIMGDPPQYQGHKLKALETPTASIPGQEQFGINVVANTTPALGANPAQVPKEETSFGQVIYGKAETGYDTANQYKYASGDVIARSVTDSGRTDYTISMILNISNSTPAGLYAGDFAAIVMPAY